MASPKTLERLRWRQLYWNLDSIREFADSAKKGSSRRPAILPLAEVVSRREYVVTLGMGHTDSGPRYVAAGTKERPLDAPGTDPRRWLDEFYESADEACAVLACLARDLEPQPWMTAVRRLAKLRRSELRHELASRHGWTCHICGEDIPAGQRLAAFSVAQPDPRFPDIEHVIPLGMGGAHWWPNLRLAHRGCNQRMGVLDTGRDRAVEGLVRSLEALGFD